MIAFGMQRWMVILLSTAFALSTQGCGKKEEAPPPGAAASAAPKATAGKPTTPEPAKPSAPSVPAATAVQGVAALVGAQGKKAAAGERVTVRGVVDEVAERPLSGKNMTAILLVEKGDSGRSELYCFMPTAPANVQTGQTATFTGTFTTDDLYGALLPDCSVANP
jgi:hypothetical protein